MNTISVMLDQIRMEARNAGLSDGEVARRAGITPEAFSRLGKAGNGRFDTVEKLASVVGYRLKLVPDDEYLSDLLEGKLIRKGGAVR